MEIKRHFFSEINLFEPSCFKLVKLNCSYIEVNVLKEYFDLMLVLTGPGFE